MRYSTDMDGLALNFVHKRIIRAATGFVTGGPTGAVGGFFSRPAPRLPTRPTVSPFATARPSVAGAQEREVGRASKFAGPARSFGRSGGACIIPGQRRDPRTGNCSFFLGTQSGRDDDPIIASFAATEPPGEAVMGRYGVAMVPGNRVIDRATCLRGMKLGNDSLCYDKIRNSDRMWPRGARPLLTGGEMRAISIASRAAGRLTRTAVRLQEIGLIKKPVTRKQIKKKN